MNMVVPVSRGVNGLHGLGQICSDGTTYVTGAGCPDGGSPACPSGYTLGNTGPMGSYSCVSATAPALIGTSTPPAICPIGSTCTFFKTVPDTYVYLSGAALLLLLMMRR